MNLPFLSFVCVVLFGTTFTAQAETLWEKTKSVASGAVEAVEATAETVGDAVSGEEITPSQARAEIDSNAEAALTRLFRESSAAKGQFEAAAGYAVFDTRKFSFIITTAQAPALPSTSLRESEPT